MKVREKGEQSGLPRQEPLPTAETRALSALGTEHPAATLPETFPSAPCTSCQCTCLAQMPCMAAASTSITATCPRLACQVLRDATPPLNQHPASKKLEFLHHKLPVPSFWLIQGI